LNRHRLDDVPPTWSLRKCSMSLDRPKTIEASIQALLSDHFENHENPHETIYKIWLLVNARVLIERAASKVVRAGYD